MSSSRHVQGGHEPFSQNPCFELGKGSSGSCSYGVDALGPYDAKSPHTASS